jgi:hypothetical protein
MLSPVIDAIAAVSKSSASSSFILSAWKAIKWSHAIMPAYQSSVKTEAF